MNLVRGLQNFIEDWERNQRGVGPVGTDDYKVGENLATIPSKVIYSIDAPGRYVLER